MERESAKSGKMRDGNGGMDVEMKGREAEREAARGRNRVTRVRKGEK